MDKHFSELAALHKEQQEKAAKDAAFVRAVIERINADVEQTRGWLYGNPQRTPEWMKELWKK